MAIRTVDYIYYIDVIMLVVILRCSYMDRLKAQQRHLLQAKVDKRDGTGRVEFNHQFRHSGETNVNRLDTIVSLTIDRESTCSSFMVYNNNSLFAATFNIHQAAVRNIIHASSKEKGNGATALLVIRYRWIIIVLLNNQDIAKRIAVFAGHSRFTSESSSWARRSAFLIGRYDLEKKEAN